MRNMILLTIEPYTSFGFLYMIIVLIKGVFG